MAKDAMLQRGGRPLIFGEVLFDRFPDGTAVLGGAPFNVAWHLQGFGARPLLISRVGADAPGQQVRERMQQWGMDPTALQQDGNHPTGAVDIDLVAGEPRFDILPRRAYDFIDTGLLARSIGDIPGVLLYHGSLIGRAGTSRCALHWLRRHVQLPVFVDINLRPPWWHQEEIDWALTGADWLKLNDHELATLIAAPHDALRDAADAVRHRYGIAQVIVTRGDKGALLIDQTGAQSIAARPVTELVDTVGAGDAFSAVVIFGLLNRWPTGATLDRAVTFAAAICGIRGATTTDVSFYRRFLDQWED